MPNYPQGHEPPRKPEDSGAHGIREQLRGIQDGIDDLRKEYRATMFGRDGEPSSGVVIRLDRLEQYKADSIEVGKLRDKRIFQITLSLVGTIATGVVAWIVALISGHVKLLP